MSQWARNNPEKVGSDPRTHVPGYGSPASPDEIGGSCTICACPLGAAPFVGDGDGMGQRFAHAECYERRAAGLAYQAENDKQAAENDRYMAAKPAVINGLRAVRHQLMVGEASDARDIKWCAEQVTSLLRKIEGTEG